MRRCFVFTDTHNACYLTYHVKVSVCNDVNSLDLTHDESYDIDRHQSHLDPVPDER